MQIETRQYEFSHGKKPRGFGTWAFFFDGKRDADQAFWFSGSYGDAAAAARAEAGKRKAHRVEVGS